MGLILPATLMPQRIVLLAPTRESNGAGGWTETFATVATVNGQLYEPTTGMRSAGNDTMVGGALADVELVEVAIDTTGVTLSGSMRFEDPDGNQYEIVRVKRQGALARVLGRKV